MRLPGVPRERVFYQLFQRQAEYIQTAADLLVTSLSGGDRVELRSRIRDCEHSGDEVTHEVVRRLNSTFVTPFDREDIYALTSGLDDVLDYIDEVADTLVLYRFGTVPEAAVHQARLIREASTQLCEAMRVLEQQSGLAPFWIEVHRLENEGDRVSRQAIGELFANGMDPVELIRLKDLFTLLEDGLDRCEDVANVVESIVIKNA
jgi:uncharacterized protein Yka (UPF0111/DUF47 family)